MKLVAGWLLGCAMLFAQAVSQISGTARDPSGAVVQGVEVTVIQTQTGARRNVISDENGNYILPNLPLGPYRLEAVKSGFRTYVQTGIELQVGSNPDIPIVLGLGEATQTVEVQANASQVETRTTGVGTVVETQRILDLPTNGRQPTDLITLGGAAVQTAASRGFGMRTGVLISVAGGNTDGVQYTLDGAPHSNLFDGSGMPLPFPDALQEFKISTSTQNASSGGHSGAAVSAVMKSGTNALHGDVFEFVRNYGVNARDFFATKQDGLKRNQFGGTLGGPIRKDKLFFFLGYQGTLIRQTPISNVTFVPTPQMLTGDFTAFASPACQNGRTIALRAPFVNNQINPALLSPAALKIAARLPKALDVCGRFLTGNALHENDNEAVSRVDYQLSGKQTLFARFMLTKQQTAVPYTLTPSDVLTAGGFGADDQFGSLVLGHTYLLSSTMVNSFRLSGNRIRAIKPGANMFGPGDVGINAYTYQPHYLTIPVTGGFSLGSGNFSENSFAYTTVFGFNDDLTFIKGAHQFAFGGYYLRSIEWSVAQAWSGGSYTVSGGVTGLGMADFFVGAVSQFRQANPNPLNLNQNFIGLYAQDTWKVTPKLTLTYGVNWAPFLAMSFPQGDAYNFSLARFQAGQRSTAIPNAPPGFTYPGDPGFAGKSGINTRWTNVDPRVGLAWDPAGDGKTAIRLGAGIAHDFIEQDLHLNTSSVSPFRLTIINTGVNLDNPWATFPGGNPFPYNFNRNNPLYVPYSGYLPVPPNMNTHVQYTWNAGIQRQVTPRWFVSGSYVGTHIIHVWNAVELNPAIYVPGNCAAGQYGLTAPGPCTSGANVNQRRVLNQANPQIPLGYLTQYDDGGTQTYNGLLLSTNWRLQNNLSLNANYTWSHCVGLPVITLLNPGANYIHGGYGQNVGPANRNLDIGDCLQDRRQIANVTLVYQTPRFANTVARMLGTGWTFGTTIVGRTGAPLTIVTGAAPDPANGFGGNTPGTQRPNLVRTDTASATRRQACANLAPCVSWLNTAAFTAPATGTFGNLGVGAIRGPGFWEWDQSVSREFRIRESQTINLRFEAFNVTNGLRPGNPGVTIGSANTFGVITTDATPPSPTTAPARVIQFAAKFVF
ncbi:MAG: hypothetical protein C5B51_26175 [Terriglobia bacterium]|nr:MAG: hypothetical protein C5B51_26175 [Terriglobia bacterium]